MRNGLKLAAALALIISLSDAAHAKTGRSYYTGQVLKTVRENLAAHDWARAQRDQILERANGWLKHGTDELLFRLVPPPGVARAYTVHNTGCPVHGEAAHKEGRYAWGVSPDEPWKIRCPAGGETYPSNDFAAYLRGGMKDRALLTGGGFVDDGWGWRKDGVDKKFWFVSYYAHWIAYRHLIPALEDLSRAYLLTDDPRYAHAAAALLWQLAAYYPDYNYETQSRTGTEFNPDYKGRLLYHTWESLRTAQSVPPAYDAIWPAIANDTELQQRTGQSPEQIRSYIETRLLRTMVGDIMDGSHRIQGNWGMHQVALLRLAAVLDDNSANPTSKEMIDWVLQNDHATLYTDIGLYDALSNLIHRDGYPFESPGYNVHWITEVLRIAEALRSAGIELTDHPRFAPLLRWPMKMLVAGRFSQALGDSGNMFAGAIGLDANLLEAGYRYTGDAAFARAMVQADVKPRRELFEPYAGDDVLRAAEAHPAPVGVRSSILPAAGIATLQSGDERNRTAVSLFYGYYVGHAHYDRLQMDLFSRGWALTPDFGYPETADNFDPRRFGFFSHTVSHNTVMIDATRQVFDWGELHAYDPGEFAQMLEVSAERAYPGKASLYRRTLLLVDAAPDSSYLVDIFRVRGGRQHDYLVHGTQAETRSTLDFSTPAKKGTLAGKEVPYGLFFDDPKLRDAPAGSVSYSRYTGSGFQFLFNVQRAALDGGGAVSWHLNRPQELVPKQRSEGIVLRAHLVGRDETVFLADGKPQLRSGWPDAVKFLVRRRIAATVPAATTTAPGGLESVFVTVYEPYDRTPFIESVQPLVVTGGEAGLPVGLEIRLADGKRHIVFSRLELAEGPSAVEASSGALVTDARAAVIALDGNTPTRRYALSAGRLQWAGQEPLIGSAAIEARVQTVDYAQGVVTLDRPVFTDAVAAPAGGLAIVRSNDHATAVPVAAVQGNNAFSVGAHDLAAARARVQSVDGTSLRVSPPFLHFARPGMTLADESGRVLGRIRSIDGGMVTLDRAAPRPEDLLDEDGDGNRYVRILAVGVGDRITLHRAQRR